MADESETTQDYPAGALVFRTAPHAGSWTSSEGDTYADQVVVEKPSETLIRDAGHAHAAGVLEVLQGLDLAGVQSQEDGEAAYAEAQGDWVEPVYDEGGTLITPGHWSGPWQEGQDLQAALDAEARARGDATIVVDIIEDGGES
jgi:hypothetical protein